MANFAVFAKVTEMQMDSSIKTSLKIFQTQNKGKIKTFFFYPCLQIFWKKYSGNSTHAHTLTTLTIIELPLVSPMACNNLLHSEGCDSSNKMKLYWQEKKLVDI